MSSDQSYIAHVDMDAFFARVEKLDNPELEDRPVIVGGLGKRGVVSTACYRAREYDVHSAMAMETARERCPQAEFIAPRTNRYREVSEQLRTIYESFTPSYKPVSLDEAYLDVTGVMHKYDSPEELGRAIRESILEETDLTASVGIGPNKMIAKLSSDYDKPDGLKVVEDEDKKRFVGSLDVDELPGIGPNTLESMKSEGIRTVGDLQAMSVRKLTDAFGQRGIVYHRKARGEGASELELNDPQKSISNEETYSDNLEDPSRLLDRLHYLTSKVCRRLRKKELEAKTIFIKERRGDFTTFTRQRTVTEYLGTTETIWEWVQRIFTEEVSVDSRGIRLQGVGLKNLRPAEVQAELFQNDNEQKRNDLNRLVDDINEDLGDGSVIRGRDLETDS
ncbi:MAG: DNA polymerase IV [bacterium]